MSLRYFAATAATGLLVASLGGAGGASADDFTFRIASGHAPTVVYVDLMKNYFEPELKKRVEERTKHTVNFVEGYSGSIVKVNETLEGVQDGIVDIGGFCFCFEPSNLPLHAFQVMLPFGPTDPKQSLATAQAVYAKVPYLTEVFEQKFNQKLLARITDGAYNLGTTFPWKDLADLKGQKIAGAGLNLNWLNHADIVGVQSSVPEAYTNLSNHVYDGWIMFPSVWLNVKLYEPAPYYTLIGFGAITWHGLTINLDKWNSLPPEVQDIMVEVAKDFEEQTGIVNASAYGEQVEKLKGLTHVSELPADVRLSWAKAIAHWPQVVAHQLDDQGLPASDVLKLTLKAAEDAGYTWPVRYEIQ
jgi:TRAP-type C4-dicarboxylate transport system substrate-binding protein